MLTGGRVVAVAVLLQHPHDQCDIDLRGRQQRLPRGLGHAVNSANAVSYFRLVLAVIDASSRVVSGSAAIIGGTAPTATHIASRHYPPRMVLPMG